MEEETIHLVGASFSGWGNNDPIDAVDLIPNLWGKLSYLRNLYANGHMAACLRGAEWLALQFPADDDIDCWRVSCYEHFGRHIESNVLLSKVLDRSPTHVRANYLRGRHSLLDGKGQRLDTGNPETALWMAESALRFAHEHDPKYVAGTKDLADCLATKGRPREALDLIQDIRFAEQEIAEVRTNGLALLGEVLMALDPSAECAKRVIADIAPEVDQHAKFHPRALLMVAQAHERAGNPDLAGEYRDQAQTIEGGRKLQARSLVEAAIGGASEVVSSL